MYSLRRYRAMKQRYYDPQEVLVYFPYVQQKEFFAGGRSARQTSKAQGICREDQKEIDRLKYSYCCKYSFDFIDVLIYIANLMYICSFYAVIEIFECFYRSSTH